MAYEKALKEWKEKRLPAHPAYEEALDRLRALGEEQTTEGKMLGSLSAITRYLNAAQIPPAHKIQSRVKLLTLMYQESQARIRHLETMIELMTDQE